MLVENASGAQSCGDANIGNDNVVCHKVIGGDWCLADRKASLWAGTLVLLPELAVFFLSVW